MKLILNVLATLTISTLMFLNIDLSEKKSKIHTDIVVFDGFEGNLYFFTNSSKEALTIEGNNSKAFEKYNLKNNNHVGSIFILSLNQPGEKVKNYITTKAVIDLKLEQNKIATNYFKD